MEHENDGDNDYNRRAQYSHQGLEELEIRG